MATLTEASYYTRRGINWAILLIVVYFILRILWSFFVAFWLFVFPPKPPPPNHAFNKLPPVSFPRPESSPAATLNFKLETITGGFPRASESARVYFMPKAAANLLAINRTQEFAKKLTFDPTPIQETRTVYRFNDSESPIRKLRYDIVSNNFIMRYAFEQDTGLFAEGSIKDTTRIRDEAIDILQTNKIFNSDLSHGAQKITLLKLVSDRLVSVENLSQANAIRVDFFRSSINTLRVVTPHPDEGEVRMIFSGSLHPKKHIVEMVYTFWPVDYQTYATYKLKPAPDAWQELQNGGGYIARYPNDGGPAVIRSIYLAYYDSFEPQTFLQPIYVFEGDHGVAGYVSAISPEWVQ